ncbi:hypothetical protein HKD37_17G047458 [Glycine soja]
MDHTMDSNINFDTLLDQIIDEELEDNTDEEVIRRFCMQRYLFLRFVEAFTNHDEYFQMRVDAKRRNDLSPLQKCIGVLRILAYGLPVDSVNEYIQIAEITVVECLQRFVSDICAIFGDEYLRRPNDEDTRRLLQMGAICGFSGCTLAMQYAVNET